MGSLSSIGPQRAAAVRTATGGVAQDGGAQQETAADVLNHRVAQMIPGLGRWVNLGRVRSPPTARTSRPARGGTPGDLRRVVGIGGVRGLRRAKMPGQSHGTLE